MAEYIERDALSKWLHETMSVQTTTVGMAYVRDFWNKVLDTPTADVAPVVHGRWIRDEKDMLVCSNCHTEPLLDDYNFWAESDYCPNCGARMDGE